MRRAIRRRRQGDRGAAVVELAIVMPVIMILLLGMVSGASSWNQSQSIGHGGQVAARWASTVPLPAVATDMDDWLDDVIDQAIAGSTSTMDADDPGRAICVAFVDPRGAAADQTYSRRMNAAGVRTDATTECFSDGQPSTERRVQVVMQRSSYIEIGFLRQPLTLTRQVVFRYEADGGL